MTTQQQNIDWTPVYKYLDDNFATKADIKKIMIAETNEWINKIDKMTAVNKIVSLVIKRLSGILATKQDLRNLREELLTKFSHLPTKEEFYKKMDKWMKATNTADLEKSAHKLDHTLLHTHLASSHTHSSIL